MLKHINLHIQEAINHNPDIIIDDGCDIVSTIHAQRPDLISKIIGSTEETTTGITQTSSKWKRRFSRISGSWC